MIFSHGAPKIVKIIFRRVVFFQRFVWNFQPNKNRWKHIFLGLVHGCKVSQKFFFRPRFFFRNDSQPSPLCIGVRPERGVKVETVASWTLSVQCNEVGLGVFGPS